jgi:hypothetical protein
MVSCLFLNVVDAFFCEEHALQHLQHCPTHHFETIVNDKEWKIECDNENCNVSKMTLRIISLTGKSLQPPMIEGCSVGNFSFCNCSSKVEQLINMGFFPGSPVSPGNNN